MEVNKGAEEQAAGGGKHDTDGSAGRREMRKAVDDGGDTIGVEGGG